MNSKELLKHFKAADWKGHQEVEAFAYAAGDVASADLIKLLEVLAGRRLPGDGKRQALRCRAFARLAATNTDKALFSRYLQALKGGDTDVRKTIAPLLIAINDVKRHDELCTLLESSDSELRGVAARILAAIGGKTALDIMGEQVARPGFRGRREAVEIAAATAKHHAIPLLRAVLMTDDQPAKLLAIDTLAGDTVREGSAVEISRALKGALSDADERIVARAIGAYVQYCDDEAFEEDIAPFLENDRVGLVKAAVQSLSQSTSRRGPELLNEAFRRGPNMVRSLVLDVAESIGNDDILPLLVEALAFSKITIRTRASEVLSALSAAGKLDISRTVLWLLRSPDTNVRRMAAEIVANAPDSGRKMAPKLLRFLRDEDWWVRERVTDGLARLLGESLTRHIAGYLDEPSDVLRRFAVDALARLKDPKSLGALVNTARTDRDWWVQERAVEVIGELGDPRAIPHVVDLMVRFDHLQLAGIATLKMLEAHGEAPKVARLLASSDADVRRAALAFFDELDLRSERSAVEGLLFDPDPALRRDARALLTRWGMAIEEVQSSDVSTSLLDQLLFAVAKIDGSDLLVAPDRPVYVKRLGSLIPLGENKLSLDEVNALVASQLNSGQRKMLAELKEVDFSYQVKGAPLRFRVNVFVERGGLAAVFRLVPNELPALSELGLPDVVQTLGDLHDGLVLVGGPTGSGKSTTLGALISYINQTSPRHIITLEDPIEMMHAPKKAVINQREIGVHTLSFPAALRSALRQDPDVILVGEMRDLETISFAVTAAETGHLVFGTVHTVSAATSVDRIINTFPPGQQDQARSVLAESLKAVVCQHLLRHKTGLSRCLAVEVMLNNDAIRQMIRQGKTYQIPSVMLMGRDDGIQLMDDDLKRLYESDQISAEELYMKSANKQEFEDLVFGTDEDETDAGVEGRGQMQRPGSR